MSVFGTQCRFIGVSCGTRVSEYPQCIVWFCHKARVWQTDRQTDRQHSCSCGKNGQAISVHSWDITTSGFWNKRAPYWKFYFRFRLWAFHWHRHAILFGVPNFIRIGLSSVGGGWTSNRFSKMAATLSQIYFRFPLWRHLTFRMVLDNYLRTKFRQDISFHGWDITASGFWKQNRSHIDIVLSVSTLTFPSASACVSCIGLSSTK